MNSGVSNRRIKTSNLSISASVTSTLLACPTTVRVVAFRIQLENSPSSWNKRTLVKLEKAGLHDQPYHVFLYIKIHGSIRALMLWLISRDHSNSGIVTHPLRS